MNSDLCLTAQLHDGMQSTAAHPKHAMLLAGDSVGLYVGPKSLLDPVPDTFTIFATDKEPPYIRAPWTCTAKMREKLKEQDSEYKLKRFWGSHGCLSAIAKLYPKDYTGPFCIGVTWTVPVPSIKNSPSAASS